MVRELSSEHSRFREERFRELARRLRPNSQNEIARVELFGSKTFNCR